MDKNTKQSLVLFSDVQHENAVNFARRGVNFTRYLS